MDLQFSTLRIRFLFVERPIFAYEGKLQCTNSTDRNETLVIDFAFVTKIKIFYNELMYYYHIDFL